ncbi:arsenate reductase [Altererythrobacter sp. KTW20L]|uniref:arsenate reductase n=1 Tax=Altererythrobacter sp. KTW20L TaxID=2942210 RepID=UPI0020C122CF|nr:arsenate reductase [Altererythrobacter sp. KTW20L]MCL6250060.1 arsenate reductase [Altererythrobacter sp. KTW20L]
MTIHLHGIPNCDTVKKARDWLDKRGLEYTFHDYKKEGADPVRVSAWLADKGADVVLNRRGTTFRKLTDADRARADSDAVVLMVEQPSLIKRPVVEHGDGLLVGFNQAEWEAVLG